MSRIVPQRNNRQRFMNLIQKDSSNSCWLFPYTGSNGYGCFTLIETDADGNRTEKTVSSHRYGYSLKYGAIPPGRYICHRCSSRACSNPAHLYCGDAKSNADDCKRQGHYQHRADRKPREPLSADEKSSFLTRYRAGETIHAITKNSGRSYTTVRNSVRSSIKNEIEEATKPTG